jgi:hypothetical protein
MTELHRSKEMQNLQQCSIKICSKLLEYQSNNDQSQTIIAKHSSKSIELLLEKFEGSSRGYRTNPFIQNESPKLLVASRCINNIHDKEKPSYEKNTDSEMHRKAWAEMIGAVLDFALTLTVSHCFISNYKIVEI